MGVEATYPAPDNAILRWLAEIGDDLPEEVRRRLRAAFFTSRLPLIVGGFNSVVVAGTIHLMTGRPLFLVLALADLALLAVRVVLIRRTSSPSGPIFATGLLWAGLQSVSVFMIVSTGHLALSLLVLATGLAAVGGIISRNYAAPRYALTQVLMIDASYKVAFWLAHREALPLLLFQTVLFVVMNVGIIRQHRAMAIEAIRGEFASRRQALTDPLTGLSNRRALEERHLADAGDARDRALLALDLDGFKQVNDRLGHAAGDRLLQLVAERLTSVAGPRAKACRLGGDEFLILIEGTPASQARTLAARVIAGLAAPYEIETGSLARVGVSVGVALDADGTAPLARMMTEADRALYAAKGAGGGVCRLHDELRRDPPADAMDRIADVRPPVAAVRP